MNGTKIFLLFAILLLAYEISSFSIISSTKCIFRSKLSLNMGLGDMFKNALANDPNLPPAQNAGLSGSKQPVEVEFLPSKKKVRAFPGERLSVVANAAKIDIKYKCKKGDCGTCKVNFEGNVVKACQTVIPSGATKKSYKIALIPSK